MLFIVDNMLGFSQFESAFGLCLLLIELCDMNCNDEAKMQIYIKMARLSFNLKLYRQAIKILHKTLELSMIFNDRDMELKVYDLLGYTYYLMNELNYAKHYHNK